MSDSNPATPCNDMPLAIIGIGCMFPKSDDSASYWSNIAEGIDAITDIPATHWQPADHYDKNPKTPDTAYGRMGGFLTPIEFNPMEFNIPPNALEAIDSSQLLGLVAAGQALKDAGYGPEKEFDRSRTSVILGVTGTLELVIPLGARLGHPIWRKALKEAGVDETVAEDVVQRIGDSYVGWQENSFPGLLGNVVAGRISKQYDLGGTNCVVDAACASSLGAIHLAAMELATGKSDLVITGGIDTFNDIFMYVCFSKTPALSPSGHAKPFDSSADGTTLGEGLGIVVLKRLADAERDGDRIYAVIKGIGSSSDGKGEAIYTPSASGQKKAVQEAYANAGINPDSIGLLEAHGTGTKVGDGVEVNALRDVYGEADHPWCALGSVKSQIGHTKASAGAAGLIKAALALHHKVLPPTIKIQKPLQEVVSGRTPFYLNNLKRPWLSRSDEPRRAAISALGFGGSNFHVVLEEHNSQRTATDWSGDIQLITLSSPTASGLETALGNLPVNGNWNEIRSASADSRRIFDPEAPCRLTLVAERNQTPLTTLVNNAKTMLTKNSSSSWITPDGTCYACSEKSGKTAILFPGQGTQYTGMLRDLACRFPEMLETLSAADVGYRTATGALLSDLIYPPTPFDDQTKADQDTALRATEAAQPAIGAVSLAAFKILTSFGVIPSALAGHSYGELTALCAAGRFDEVTLHELSRLRGHLMADGEGDKGSMLAVAAPLATVEQMLAEEKLDLVIANRNAPTQAVLSGITSEIERAVTACAARKLTAKQLPVAAAFHSRLVADAAAPFKDALDRISFNEARVSVFSNTTATEYPADSAEARALLANQLASPVEFVSQIEAMYAAGVRTFIEAGPGARLTGLVDAILADREHFAIAIDSSSGKRSGLSDLARTLGRLSTLGCKLNLHLWDGDYRAPATPAKKPLLTVPICGANYVKPKTRRPPVERKPTAGTNNSAATPAFTNSVALHSAQSPASRDALAESLRVTREGMAVLQRMQEETAQLHRRFLEGQEVASRTIQTLLTQQQQILQGGVTPHHALGHPIPVREDEKNSFSLGENDRVRENQPTAIVAAQPATNLVIEALLSVISEKTGYPIEMLELDMGMDSDLGIDSIKRVEILSALQERLPGSPVIGPEHLGTLRTLRDISVYLGAGNSVAAQSNQPVNTTDNVIIEALLSVISEKTGYPIEMLELDMGMDSDLGIDSIKRVEILSALQERLPGSPVIGPEHLGTLRTLGDIAAYLGGGKRSESSAGSENVQPQEPTAKSHVATIPEPVNRSSIKPAPLSSDAGLISLADEGEIWVTDDGSAFSSALCSALKDRGRKSRLVNSDTALHTAAATEIVGLVIVAPDSGTDDSFLESAFMLLKQTASPLRRASDAGGAFFTTVSRLDGAFGFSSGSTLSDPMSGGLAGLVKTAAREWPEITCKAIDLGGFTDSSEAALQVSKELFRNGPVEVGITPEGRTMLLLADLPAPTSKTPSPINPGDVIVVTGGGRGVTTAAVVALAEAYHPQLVLLGRSSELMPEPAWLGGVTDEAMIKRGILEHSPSKLHPREIEEQFRAIVAGRELRDTLARVEAAGGSAVYRSVDIRDTSAVSTLLQEIRNEYGPIRGIVHGAGVLADRLITEKTSEQFAQVYGTKVAGLRALLDATKVDDLRFIALFGSTTGRFGRIGQADYAVANEVLNKLAQAESRRRPDCRTVSINWGPWDGGMVTPALKKVFANEGIGLIGLAEGGKLLVEEIAAKDAPVEVVALVGKIDKNLISVPGPATSKPLAEVLGMNLTIDDYPFLRSHVMDGKAVLPMAMIVEWLSHAALHGNPGFRFHGFNDLRICKGVVFEHNKPYSVKLMAGKAEKRDALYLVKVELVGTNENGVPLLHAKGEVVLTNRLPKGIRVIPDPQAAPYTPLDGRIYDPRRLFHGADLQGITQVESCSDKGISALVKAAPQPAGWIKQPLRTDWLTDPMALDCAFQMMILWSFERFGAASLPCFAGRYRQFTESYPKDGVHVVIRVTIEREHGATADMEFLDRTSGKLVARLEGYECVIDPSLERAFQLNQLPEGKKSSLRAA